jgi:Ca2+-binding EF-hand superfamily protein
MFAQVRTRQPGPPTWAEVLEELDADESGTVSWKELSDFFKQIAKEHDYKLTKEDLEQAHEIFKMVDTDKSGEIDKKEFEAAMEAAGALGQKSRKMFAQVTTRQPGPPTWAEVLEELDADESGTVSWDELSDFFKQIAKEHDYKLTKEDLEQAHEIFKMVDTDKSGDIDKKEFEAAMEAAGARGQKSREMFAQVRTRQPGPPTWAEVLEELDADESGTVSWDELSDFFKQIAKEHDYKLTKEDLEQAHEVFKMIDTDKSGDIDKKEFEAAMEAAGARGQKSRKMFAQVRKGKGGAPSWEDVLEVLDADASGTVSWDEIVAFIKKVEKEHDIKIPQEDKKAIKAAFEQVDADGSGDIDKAEFEAAVAAMEGLAVLKKYM